MAHQAATLDDVAKLSGVSKSTVSRILSAKPGDDIPFSDETQAKVRMATARLGYRPSRIARGLLKSRTGIIGLVVPSVQDSFFPSVTSAIEERLAAAGFSVLLANTRGAAAVEKEKIDELLSWRVDGLIIAPAQETTDAGFFWDIWRQQVPFVLIDRVFPDTPFASVTTDDAQGARLAVEHLIARGARHIACAGGPMGVSTCRVRSAAYRDTLIHNGMLPQEDYVIDVPSTAAGGRDAVKRLLQLDPRPDALFCFSDMLAAGAMAACLESGLRIPDDLALVGYADLEYSDLLRISLTTVRQPCDLLGQTTADLLVARLSSSSDPAPHKTVPVELVVRASA
jgi:LacI family transcriptional regulator